MYNKGSSFVELDILLWKTSNQDGSMGDLIFRTCSLYLYLSMKHLLVDLLNYALVAGWKLVPLAYKVKAVDRLQTLMG